MRNIKKAGLTNINKKPGRENAIVDAIDFQIPVPQLMRKLN